MSWPGWTDETVAARAKALFVEGKTAREVAEAIGAPSHDVVRAKAVRDSWSRDRSPETVKACKAAHSARVAESSRKTKGWPGWTPENIAAVRAGYERGDTTAAIAKAIMAPSRHSVIGKAHRLGLSQPAIAARTTPLRAPPIKAPPVANPLGVKHRQSKPNQAPLIWGVPTGTAPKPPAMPAIRADARAYDQTSRKLTCIELTSQTCKFGTHEEGDEVRFCGHQVRLGSVYCAPHAARCVHATSSAKELARSLRRHVAA